MKTTITALTLSLILSACADQPKEVVKQAEQEPLPKTTGCNLSMRQIKPAPGGSVTAVTGLLHCPPDRLATQSVLLYAKGEAINAKEPNVYTTSDTTNLISISWAHDTLVVTQQALVGTPSLQKEMVDGTPVRYIVVANMASL